MTSRLLLTREGFEKIKAELTQLKKERRPEIAERIQIAKEHGDLAENAEYHMAREEQSFLEGRILELEAILSTADVAFASAGDTIGVGSTFTARDIEGNDVSYKIVGVTEADPVNKKITSESPLGKAFIGKRVGDSVPFAAPNGINIIYTITRVT